VDDFTNSRFADLWDHAPHFGKRPDGECSVDKRVAERPSPVRTISKIRRTMPSKSAID
jgi:hypothetical protein